MVWGGLPKIGAFESRLQHALGFYGRLEYSRLVLEKVSLRSLEFSLGPSLMGVSGVYTLLEVSTGLNYYFWRLLGTQTVFVL